MRGVDLQGEGGLSCEYGSEQEALNMHRMGSWRRDERKSSKQETGSTPGGDHLPHLIRLKRRDVPKGRRSGLSVPRVNHHIAQVKSIFFPVLRRHQSEHDVMTRVGQRTAACHIPDICLLGFTSASSELAPTFFNHTAGGTRSKISPARSRLSRTRVQSTGVG